MLFSSKVSPRAHGSLTNDNWNFHASLLRTGLRSRLVPAEYPRGAQLCLEGQSARGIFSIHSGQAKEYFTSTRGKTAIVRIVNPGDVVGLEAILDGYIYLTTVEVIEPVKAAFITSKDLLNAIRSDDALRLSVVKELTYRCKGAYHDIRQFGPSVPARVAQFLLEQTGTSGKNEGEIGRQLLIDLTHEEIAHRIGSTRETVSRILTFFRRKRWIRINGPKWRIENRARLTELVAQ